MTRTTTRITFQGLDHSDAVEARVHEHVEKLNLLYPALQRCDVVVAVPHRHRRRGRRFEVRIELVVPGRVIEVSHDPGDGEAHDDVYVAMRDSFLAARRQLEAYVHREKASA
jgi:ribosome-associated translation inhibitor RaiA